jgi:6-phosphogluconate dehydrogenase
LENEAKGKSIVGAHSIKEFCAKLKKPRRMMMLVMAGKPVDDFIELLINEGGIEEGDIIIDGGNSHYPDTNRRTKYLAQKGIRFVGSGVSGGEEGARYGPSIMPGGNEEAWPYIKVRWSQTLYRAHLTTNRTFSSPSLPSPMARPAASGSVTRVLATTSRWSTTVSSTVTCS